ncbi:MAG: hypothetical protein HY548_02395 [Elusimicrobia bacterium]|nr:hypothetical protein [Elusimicrobiota bacterium]
MFRLKKLHPPFGTPDAPQFESSYSEGMIPVVDGLCEVQLPETRDRLLKLGYEEVQEESAPTDPELAGFASDEPEPVKRKRRKKGRR